MARLLNKLGADLLGSIIQKVNKTLDVVRDSFTYAEQMGAIFKFLVDQTQTPNSKVCNCRTMIFFFTKLQLQYMRVMTKVCSPNFILIGLMQNFPNNHILVIYNFRAIFIRNKKSLLITHFFSLSG